MRPCTRNHCPSIKNYCQRPSCTLALRHRLERRRVERDRLQAKLKADTLNALKTLVKLMEHGDEITTPHLARVKRDFESHAAKPVGSLKCFCAECAIEHKDRAIAAIKKHFEALEGPERALDDVRRMGRRGKAASGSSGSVRAEATGGKRRQVGRTAAPASGGFSMTAAMRGLSVTDLLDRGMVFEREKERLIIPRRHRH